MAVCLALTVFTDLLEFMNIVMVGVMRKGGARWSIHVPDPVLVTEVDWWVRSLSSWADLSSWKPPLQKRNTFIYMYFKSICPKEKSIWSILLSFMKNCSTCFTNLIHQLHLIHPHLLHFCRIEERLLPAAPGWEGRGASLGEVGGGGRATVGGWQTLQAARAVHRQGLWSLLGV